MSLNRLALLSFITLSFLMMITIAVKNFTYCYPDRFAKLDGMVAGVTDRPFVNRTLMPQTLKVMSGLTPMWVTDKLALATPTLPYSYSETLDTDDMIFSPQIHNQLFYYYAILDTLILATWLLVLRYLITLFNPDIPSERLDLINLVSLLGLWPLLPGHQIYDFPSLLFATLLYGLLYQRKLHLFTLAYTLSLFNKETTVLMIIPATWWLIFQGTKPLSDNLMFKGKIKHYLITLTSIWQWPLLWLILFGLSRFILHLAFGQNNGETVQFHLYQQFDGYVSRPKESILVIFLPLCFLLFRLTRFWSDQADFLRYNFALLAPIYVILQIFFGMPLEVRVFLELYPLAVILAIHPVSRRTNQGYVVSASQVHLSNTSSL